jgi:ATP-dependent DNA helicase PIF1
MELSLEQQIAFDKYIQGENIFITGPGGSGKSELIKKIYDHASRNFKSIQVTALTGCASILLNCKAKTIHSWSGIGLGNGSVEEILRKVKMNKYATNAWKNTDVLVVDEVSMLSLKLFDILNILGKKIRGDNNKGFGGVQLIFSGDFFQLPPVGDKDDIDSQRFCFESLDWNHVFPKSSQIQLKKIFRQKDELYSSILNQIREGKIKKKSCNLLSQYVGRKHDGNLIVEPTKLFPTRVKVEAVNSEKMSLLKCEEREFNIKYIKDLNNSRNRSSTIENTSNKEKEIQMELDFLANNLICEKTMKIKIGAQVMSIINISSDIGLGVCNGSQGIVTGFCDITGCPRVKFNSGVEMIMTRNTWLSEKIPGVGVSQVPLILAWALTIHKSQGATLDAAEIDVGSGIFECGQTYVALSRVKNLEGLYLTSFDVTKIRINKKVKEYYEGLN